MNDEKYILRAIELSKLGLGRCSPNPIVGAIIVHNGRIIGEGYHMIYGQFHAEVNAIKTVKDKSLLCESTIYVTLEPCSHFGKTPPCADLIIKHKLKRVVVGVTDPYCQVQGSGIKKLIDAGIDVNIGVLAQECAHANAPFFTFNHLKRPYIILKWAESADGFIDIIRKKGSTAKWFTNSVCKTQVHKMRSEIDCIMVGRKTVELDNPELTNRDYFGPNPTRATIDPELKLDPKYKIFNKSAQTILFTKSENTLKARNKFKTNHNVIIVGLNFGDNIASQICEQLAAMNLQSLLIEGGSFLHNSFINSNLWDKAIIYKSNLSIASIHNLKEQTSGVEAPHIERFPIINRKYQNCRVEIADNEIKFVNLY